MRATPPLIDSTMYFCSGLERCSNLMPVEAVISTNWGHWADDWGSVGCLVWSAPTGVVEGSAPAWLLSDTVPCGGPAESAENIDMPPTANIIDAIQTTAPTFRPYVRIVGVLYF